MASTGNPWDPNSGTRSASTRERRVWDMPHGPYYSMYQCGSSPTSFFRFLKISPLYSTTVNLILERSAPDGYCKIAICGSLGLLSSVLPARRAPVPYNISVDMVWICGSLSYMYCVQCASAARQY